MISSGSTRSSRDYRPTGGRYEINNRPLSRLTQETPQVANTSTNQAYESLSRIEELEARILCFGHGDPSMQGTRAIVAEARAKR